MSIIAVFEDSPYYVDTVEFSGADGNVNRNNAIFLDALVQQPVIVFPQGLYKEAYGGGPTTGSTQFNFWRGAFQYRSGMNQAVYVINGSTVTTERLRIYHKRLTDAEPGTLVDDRVFPTSVTQITIDLSSAGYTNGEIIEVRAVTYFPGSILKTGVYLMRTAYTTPISSGGLGSYPGVPTFGNLNATNLNQLSNAQDWLMNRLALVPRVPFYASMFALGTHTDRTTGNNNPRVLYVGQLNKGNAQNTFHAVIDYHVFNGQETVSININGVERYESAVLTNGQSGTLDVTFDISDLGDATNHTVIVWENVVAGQGQAELKLYGNAIIPSRFTIRKLESTATRSYYTPSAEFDVLESMTFLTLKARLNNFVTGTTNTFNAINNNSNLFNQARMFRQKFGWDTHQVTSLNHVNLPTLTRIGERYVVAGKGVKIAWGGFTLKHPLTENPEERDIYEFNRTETLTGSDKVEVKEGFFDEFEGLYPGVQYYLLGEDIVFFSEFLR